MSVFTHIISVNYSCIFINYHCLLLVEGYCKYSFINGWYGSPSLMKFFAVVVEVNALMIIIITILKNF